MACFTLTMAAQPHIKVNYQGAKPTIMDFAWALVNYTPPEGDEVENGAIAQLQNALYRYRQGKAQPAQTSQARPQAKGQPAQASQARPQAKGQPAQTKPQSKPQQPKPQKPQQKGQKN